jgi:hypothetical protein
VALVVVAVTTRPTVRTMDGKMFYVCYVIVVGWVASQVQRIECLLLGGVFAAWVELRARSGMERPLEQRGGDQVKLRTE